MKQVSCMLLSLCLALNAFSQTPKEKPVNLITNGDFELGDVGFISDYARAADAGAGRYAITDDAIKFSTIYFQGKGEGKFMAVDGSNYDNRTVWEETITVKPQTEYLFSCWLSTLNTRTGSPAQLRFFINNAVVGLFKCPSSIYKWEQFLTKWTSDKKTQIKIRIVLASPRVDGNDFGLDRIKLIENPKKINPVVQKVSKPVKTRTIETKKKKVISDTTKVLPKKIEVHTDSIIEKPVILKNVLFGKGRYEILPSSFEELNKLSDYLLKNKSLNVNILGHTDNQGNKKENKILSQNRANSVRNYLIQKGIDGNRISAYGFGDEKPIDNTGSQDGRKKNRRVEFQIIRK